jgi:hypothetical protein
MPRYFILTGIPHGETKPVVILDPSHPGEEQKAAFKDYCRAGSDPGYSEVQLWSSDAGITAKRRLTMAEPAEDDSNPETQPKARGTNKPKGKPAAPKKGKPEETEPPEQS